MKNTRLMFVMLAVCLVGIAVMSYIFMPSNRANTNATPQLSQQNDTSSTLQSDTQLSTPPSGSTPDSTSINPIRNDDDIADNVVTDITEHENEAWQVSTNVRDYYRDNPEQLVADINAEEYLDIETDKIASLQIGDTMSFLIPQLGISYEALVDTVTNHNNGDVTVESTFKDEDPLFGSIITVGKKETLGTLITPYGDYIVRAKDDKAWIASRSDLEKNHDPSDDSVVLKPKDNESPINQENKIDEINVNY